MNYPMQQNYGAGLGALGPVQSMSDRNDAQMMIANRGQMFAGGGITALAEGGLDALPKYKYNPVTQQYELDDSKKEGATGIENLAPQKRSSSSDTPAPPSAWSQMTPAQQAAYYADNPRMAAVTQALQKGFGLTGIGQLASFFSPNETGKAGAIAKGFDPSQTTFGRGAGSLFGMFGRGLEAVPASLEAYGYGPMGSNYGMMGPDSISGVGVNSREGRNAMDAMSDAVTLGYSPAGGGEANPSTNDGGFTGADSNGGFGPSTSGELAAGGIASLAQGGPSHLGDYSDGGRLLRGPGDGVSDSIPATIGNKRPARLADGEFVVPARIVSELGNGSTEAGARKLYAMMDRIQKDRSKTVGKDRVAVNSRAAKNLPA